MTSESTGLSAPSPGVVVAPGETSSSAIAAREKAAVEARFLVAMHRPRNPDLARTRLLARCAAPMFAEVAEYAKPVGGGKKVRGASIRMMEEVARQWGNVDIQSTVVFDGRERRTITVSATDLESNYSASVDVILEKTVERRNPRDGDEVLGRRVTSEGNTVYRIAADEDAFLVKQNANISKARREMIRAVVPGDLVDEAMAKCGETRRSEVKTDPAAARKRIADAFFALGVMPNQLCELLDKPSLEAITEAEIELLRAIYAGMKDGEATWADVAEGRAGGKTSAAHGGPGAARTTVLRERLNNALRQEPTSADPAQAPAAPAPPTSAPAAVAPSAPVAQTDAEIRAEEQAMLAQEAARAGEPAPAKKAGR